MKDKRIWSKVMLCAAIIGVMTGGAWGIYELKNEYSMERIEKLLSSNVAEAVDGVVDVVKDNIWTRHSDVSDTMQESTELSTETTQLVLANADGNIDNSELTEQEKEYQVYIETETESTRIKETVDETTTEMITTVAVTTVTTTIAVPTTERETTPAPTTTVKKQGVVITDEKMRNALIQMGYDPDNYVAADLSFEQKSELIKLMYGEATSSPKENMRESIDWSQVTLSFDGSDLPKPMG